MVRAGDTVGVAVSGGADSVCLLHALARLADWAGVRLEVLHLNHGLRGGESDADQAFVERLAARLGLLCRSGNAKLEGGGNLEEAAREARREFFRAAMRERGLARVATGHTLSDQAETVLFRAVRGTAPGGLRGILPVTAEGLIRPLLEVTREEVRAWLAAEGLAWREDCSNSDPRFARNAIRHEVLPRLAALNPRAENALARLACSAGEDEDYWRGEAGRELAALRRGAPDGAVVLDAALLTKLHPALGRRVVRLALAEVAGSTRRFTQEHLDSAWRLAVQPEGHGRVRLPRAVVRRSLGWLLLSPPGEEAAAPAPIRLEKPGVAGNPYWELEISEAGHSRYNEGSDLLDAEHVSFPLTARCWQAGDGYRPAGHRGVLKVKELFVPAGVPSWVRRFWPILLSGGRIVWCPRFGAAAHAAATPASRRILRVRAGFVAACFETSAGGTRTG